MMNSQMMKMKTKMKNVEKIYILVIKEKLMLKKYIKIGMMKKINMILVKINIKKELAILHK